MLVAIFVPLEGFGCLQEHYNNNNNIFYDILCGLYIMKMEAPFSSKIFVTTHHMTRCYNPVNYNFRNGKYYIINSVT
jgi:hypothetical protein